MSLIRRRRRLKVDEALATAACNVPFERLVGRGVLLVESEIFAGLGAAIIWGTKAGKKRGRHMSTRKRYPLRNGSPRQ